MKGAWRRYYWQNVELEKRVRGAGRRYYWQNVELEKRVRGAGSTCGMKITDFTSESVYSKNYKYRQGGKLPHNQTFYLENYFTKQFLQFSKLSVI